MSETQAEQAQTETAETESAAAEPTAAYGADFTPERLDELEEAMRDVVDPELGINVVDLGLVYDFKSVAEDGQDIVMLDMTLTSPACPLTDVIEEQSKRALVNSGLCDELRINWVWMPPWGPDKITDDGREQLRALGFTV